MSHRRLFLRTVPCRNQPRLRGLRATQRRTRLVTMTFIGFGAILLAMGAWRATKTFESVKNEESLRAEAIAGRIADHLASVLNNRFADLRFFGHSLLAPRSASVPLSASMKKTLRVFLATQPTLRDINILSANGNRILWSARKQPSRPILPERSFHAVADSPRVEIGDPVYAKRFRSLIVPLRYRIGRRGHVKYLIGDPLDLRRLGRPVSRTRLAIRLTARSREPLATWTDGLWHMPIARKWRQAGIARANVPGYPWTVDATWSRSRLWTLWRHRITHWLPLFIILLWGSQYTGLLLVNLLSQEMQLRLWHEGLYRVNRSILEGSSVQALFNDVAQVIQGNLDASFVFVGSRDQHAIAGPAGGQDAEWLLSVAFDNATDKDWVNVSQAGSPGCAALAFGQSGGIIMACPSRAAEPVIWHGMVRELGVHLETAINQKRQKREVERLERYQEAVRVMQLELLRQPTPDEAQSLLVRILTEQTDIMGAFVATPEGTSSWLRVRAAAAQNPVAREALLHLTSSQDPACHPWGQTPTAEAFRTGVAHGPVDPAQDPTLATATHAHQRALESARAVLAYPILEDGLQQPSAVLTVLALDKEYFTPALRALLEHLVASMRLAFGAYRTRRQSDRYRAFYEALARASQAITRAAEARHMFRKICHILAECTGVPLTFISIAQASGVEIAASAGKGHDFLPVGPTGIDPQSDPLGILHARTMGAQSPCLFERRDQWLASDALRQKAEALGLVSALTVPWTHKDGVAGVLGIIANERAFFDEDLTRLMEALGNDISFAVSDYDRRQELMRLSLYDSLTTLPNRAYFEQSTVSAMARATGSGLMLALGIMDLDGFKEWNDLQGHTAGDLLLKAVAQRLREVVPDDGGVARLGGDEFGLVVNVDGAEALGTLGALSARLLSAIALADSEKRVTASVGWALLTPEDSAYATLLAHADEALYAAKAAGRNTYRIFGGDIAERLKRRLAIHQRFPEALANGQILFAIQPQIQCVTGRVEGVEILARWRNGDESMPADRFIPDVEKDPYLIRALGRRALAEGIALRNRLRAMGRDLRVALNIGAHHFLYSGFLGEVRESLEGSTAHGLCIEITESVALSDGDRAARIITELKRLGFSVALDDFGSGHSSLNEAARLPADELKLDQRFIRLFRRDPNFFAVAGAALLLGSLSGRRLIAEGIETAEDLTLWRHMGGEHIQGHVLAKPLYEEEFFDWLAQGPSWPQSRIAAFPPRDLVLVGYAFLELDVGAEGNVPGGIARLDHWMQTRASLYGELPRWEGLRAALVRGRGKTPEAARAFWYHDLRPAVLGLFEDINALLKRQQFGGM